MPLIRSIKAPKTHFKDRKNILFIGGFNHLPNVDAVKYFANNVMPLLRKRIPGIKFYIVGSNPSQEVLDLRSEDIIVLGFVDKILPLMEKFKISVAPLRYGAGIKGKIGSSMAAGLPVSPPCL